MSNRFWNTQSMQLEKQPVRLYAHVTFGASGTPTLDAKNSKGFVGVTKDATGKYTLQLGQTHASGIAALDTYFKVLSFQVLWDATGNSGTAPAAPLVLLTANNTGNSAQASLQIECTDKLQAAASPASGEGLYLEIQLGNSNTPS